MQAEPSTAVLPSRASSRGVAGSSTNFLFVRYGGVSGHTPRQLRLSIRRHVGVRSKSRSYNVRTKAVERDSASSSVSSDDQQSQGGFRARYPKYASDLTLQQETPQSIYVHSYLEDDFTFTSRWYLGPGAELAACSAKKKTFELWTAPLFNASRSNPQLSLAISLLTLHKRKVLAGSMNKTAYFQAKQEMYRSLRGRLAAAQEQDMPDIALAVSILAYVELMDGQAEVGRDHLKAMARSLDLRSLTVEQWKPLAFCDLRHAMKMDARPVLPFFIPQSLLDDIAVREWMGHEFTKSVETDRYEQSSGDMVQELLSTLRALTRHASDSTVNYGLVMVLAYCAEQNIENLCATYAGDPWLGLFTLAARLHVHGTASRYLPNTPQCREVLLSRAVCQCQAINELPDGLDDLQAENHLWALTTLAANAVRFDQAALGVVAPLLSRVKDILKIKTLFTLKQVLQKYPWRRSWGERKLPLIWKAMTAKPTRWVRVEDPSVNKQGEDDDFVAHFAGVLVFFDA